MKKIFWFFLLFYASLVFLLSTSCGIDEPVTPVSDSLAVDTSSIQSYDSTNHIIFDTITVIDTIIVYDTVALIRYDTAVTVLIDTIVVYDTLEVPAMVAIFDTVSIDSIANYTFIGCLDSSLYYFSLNYDLNWVEANEEASKYGHLVSIGSAEENQFVLEGIAHQSGQPNIWIGLSDEIEEGNWQWTSGEPFAYANWFTGEPNDEVIEGVKDGEDYVLMYGANTPIPGTWNDGSNIGTRFPHVLEVPIP